MAKDTGGSRETARKMTTPPRAAILERKLWETRARAERVALDEKLLGLLSVQSLDWTGLPETRELGGAVVAGSGHFQVRLGLQEESRPMIRSLLGCASNADSAELVYVGLCNSRQKAGLFTCTLAVALDHLFELLDLDGDIVTLIHAGRRWAISVDLVLNERMNNGYRSFYEVRILGDLAGEAERCASRLGLSQSLLGG